MEQVEQACRKSKIELNEERGKRKSMYKAMYDELDEINQRLMDDIEQERCVRERMEKTMLELLQKTCERVEQSLIQ